MASFTIIAIAFMLLATLGVCKVGRPIFYQSKVLASHAMVNASITPQGLNDKYGGLCHPTHISIRQDET